MRKNVLTEFGKFCAIIRVKSNENLHDMASRLELSESHLSNLASGKKEVTKKIRLKLINVYNLDANSIQKLDVAIYKSNSKIKIDLSLFSAYDSLCITNFLNSFKELRDSDKQSIQNILDKRKG